MAAVRPRPSHRVLRAGWVMAPAFTPDPALAALTLPWTVLAVLPGALRGGLFLDPSGTGMVLLSRWCLGVDLLVLLPVMATVTAGATAGLWLITAAAPAALAPLLVLTALLVAAGLAGALFLLPARAVQRYRSDPRHPWARGGRSGLAQLPGTRLTALQTARRALSTVPPPGAVIVAAANTPAQYEQYQRFGFTGGPQRRVHRVVA